MTPEQLSQAIGCPITRAAEWSDPLSVAMAIFGITTPQRIAMFLAQVGHESGRLKWTKEIWGPTEAQLRYEGRKDLGNLRPGDGRKYLGRGPMQVTGHSNYIITRDELRKYVPRVPDFEQMPELLEDPRWGALAAGLYWHRNNLNRFADADDIDGASDVINRGHKTERYGDANGFPDRLALWGQAKKVFA